MPINEVDKFFEQKNNIAGTQAADEVTPYHNPDDESIHFPIDSEATDTEILARDYEEKEYENIIQRGIEKLDRRTNWALCKQLSKDSFKKEHKFKFYISKEKTLKGKVLTKDNNELTEIPLITLTHYYTREGEQKDKLFFIGETISKKYADKVSESFNEDFWLYRFIAGNKTYTLLAGKDDKLDFEDYTITGTEISLSDLTDMGKYSRLLCNRNIILLHTAEKRIPKFKNNDEFFNKVKALKLSEGMNLRHFLFSRNGVYYSNPKAYEDMLTAILLSGKIDGYPLHFMGVGGAGCGKSTLLEGMHSKSNESSIFKGTTSRFKALVPSFKTAETKPGHLLSSNRFCFIDEFMQVLLNVKDEDRESQLSQLNDLLEHKRGLHASGNGSIEAQMGSKFIVVTNPVRGNKDLNQMLAKFENSFATLTRMLLFFYSDDHVKYVEEQKSNEGQIRCKATDKDDFLGIYDYLQEIECVVADKSRVRAVYDMAKLRIGQTAENRLILQMFEARYSHHLKCLLDGIVKNRCLLEQDKSFTAKEADYKALGEMLLYLLSSWNIGFIDEMRV